MEERKSYVEKKKEMKRKSYKYCRPRFVISVSGSDYIIRTSIYEGSMDDPVQYIEFAIQRARTLMEHLLGPVAFFSNSVVNFLTLDDMVEGNGKFWLSLQGYLP